MSHSKKDESPESSVDHYERIEGEAFERYLVDLIRATAAEQVRVGFVGFAVVRDVRLVGDEYPHLEVEIDSESTYNSERRFQTRHPITDARTRETAVAVVADILMEIFD